MKRPRLCDLVSRGRALPLNRAISSLREFMRLASIYESFHAISNWVGGPCALLLINCAGSNAEVPGGMRWQVSWWADFPTRA